MTEKEQSTWIDGGVQGNVPPTANPQEAGMQGNAPTANPQGAGMQGNAPVSNQQGGGMQRHLPPPMPNQQSAWVQGVLPQPMPNGQGTGTQGGDAFGKLFRETEETKRMKENYGFIVRASLAYGILYAFCMYKNSSGVAFFFFVLGSLLFFCFTMAKLGVCGGTSDNGRQDGGEFGESAGELARRALRLKKGSFFYLAAMLLLGISTFCTDDSTLIFFNKLGIFLLLMSLLLKQYFDTGKWKLGKYLSSICIMVGASAGELGRPFSDGAAYRKNRQKKTDRRIWYFALGLLIGVPLLLVVLLLLASADAVFRQMTARLLENISLFSILNVMFRITLVFFGSYALTAYLCKKRISEDVTDRRRGEPVLAITVTGLLTVIYLLFSGIQIGGLFLGQLQLPEGYTFAMYAREGFFQLLVVSLLNFVIVLACLSFFKDSKVLKIVLTLMSLCTFIMIASSFMRMMMYISYYYLTYLRILVLWALALLAVLFVGVVINIVKEGFPLFRYSMAAVAVLYLALSFARPDYIIAKVNVDNAPHGVGLIHEAGTDWTSEEFYQNDFFSAKKPYLDYAYLGTLSADAAPALVPYLEELGYYMEAFYEEDAVEYAKEKGVWSGGSGNSRSSQGGFGYYWMRRMQWGTKNFGIRTFNVSRYKALVEFKNARGNAR